MKRTFHILLAVALGLALTWLALLVALWRSRPEGPLLREAIRLLPDTLRLLRRLASDADVPTGVRVRLWLLFAYLASPLDLVPDFLPVIGYADDAIITAVVLRSVVRRAGPDVIRTRWPGSPDGLKALWRLARLPTG